MHYTTETKNSGVKFYSFLQFLKAKISNDNYYLVPSIDHFGWMGMGLAVA